MALKAQQHVVEQLTGTPRKIFEVMRDECFMSTHEIISELTNQGVSLCSIS